MRTKTVEIEGHSFTFAELSIDDIEAWEEGVLTAASTAKTMRQALASSRAACVAAVETAGVTPTGAVGKLSPRNLRALTAAVMKFSGLEENAQGEPERP